MLQPQIEVLVATYNGQRFLPQLLDSLLAQSIPANILIRDDHSTDQTPSIISYYIQTHPNRIRQIIHDGTPTGPIYNFEKLIASSLAPYILLADQDDVWDTDKIAVSLAEMQRLEKIHGTNTPLLVHTDLRVVDQNLNKISSSFFSYQKLDINRQSFVDFLIQNVVTGCTAMLNRALCEIATPIPKGVVMHDWWLALVASGFGHIGFVDRQTISYRQHGNNSLGAQQGGVGLIRRYAHQLLDRKSCALLVEPLSIQANSLLLIKNDVGSLKYQDRVAAQATAKLPSLPAIHRIYNALRFGLKKHGRLKQLAFLWALFFAKFQK